jgi:hypothetical protein
MLHDVCHDLVGSTNAAEWPHEDAVVQKRRWGTARPSRRRKRVPGFGGFRLVLLKERKCGKRAKERRRVVGVPKMARRASKERTEV